MEAKNIKTSELLDSLGNPFSYEEKMEAMNTSELLDNLGKELEDEEFDKFSSKLDSRYPFSYINTRLDEIEEKIEGLQKAIDKLKRHKHTSEGDVVVPI